MPYSLQLLEKEKIIKVIHVDGVDMKELEEARHETRTQMKENRYERVLVDTRKVKNVLRMTEHFVFNASHKEVFNPTIKIGIIFDDKTYEYNKYVEEVAQSTGTNLRAFVDENKAKDWLCE